MHDLYNRVTLWPSAPVLSNSLGVSLLCVLGEGLCHLLSWNVGQLSGDIFH